jgi:DNA-binding IclR family transcriptional regulator
MDSLAGELDGVNARFSRPPATLAKTFDNGLRVLLHLAAAPTGRTTAEVATDLGLDRTVAYRLIATAAGRGLVATDAAGRHTLGAGVLQLAAAFRRDLRAIAGPILAALAEELSATAFLTVADGAEGVVVSVSEPRATAMHVAYRAGVRHPLEQGAPGLAILAAMPARPHEREDVAAARSSGYAVTHGELQPGASGMACPLLAGDVVASVGVVTLHPLEVDKVAQPLQAAARAIAHALG